MKQISVYQSLKTKNVILKKESSFPLVLSDRVSSKGFDEKRLEVYIFLRVQNRHNFLNSNDTFFY